ncbi:MAG: hypothetical protein QOD77_913 [Thermoplasmata archaeon]|jgi:hypothetical protein|nr:hypothetical protein [Thermoplasmata archaeon]
MRLLAAACLVLALLAGCIQTQPDDAPQPPAEVERLPAVPGFTGLPLSDLPVFAAPVLVDTVRAGGEPVVAVLPSGTILVSAHPGFTHYRPGDDPLPEELLTPYAGQSFLWRSTDHGATWTHVGLNEMEEGPRGPGAGVSDPEFTVLADGTVCTTDLEALAAASVACSLDDGRTWLTGNPLASGGPVDRQWLASYQGELYFTANYFGPGADFRASTDMGLTWEDRGNTPCNSDVVADARNGHLVQGCNGTGITVSTDGGRTWSEPRAPVNASDGGARMMTEPALDAAGNVWTAWAQGEHGLWAAGTPDEGATWPWVFDLTPHARLGLGLAGNGTYVWPWISAGSAGRFAVSWIGSVDDDPSESYAGEWRVYTAFVLDATGASPSVTVVPFTPDPIHVGPICQQGTTCEADAALGDPAGDRRLGDFFETTIDADGWLLGAWSNTAAAPSDVISHPQFARQAGGVRLLADEDVGVFMPTQG